MKGNKILTVGRKAGGQPPLGKTPETGRKGTGSKCLGGKAPGGKSPILKKSGLNTPGFGKYGTSMDLPEEDSRACSFFRISWKNTSSSISILSTLSDSSLKNLLISPII